MVKKEKTIEELEKELIKQLSSVLNPDRVLFRLGLIFIVLMVITLVIFIPILFFVRFE